MPAGMGMLPCETHQGGAPAFERRYRQAKLVGELLQARPAPGDPERERRRVGEDPRDSERGRSLRRRG
jgi:hypothetical protein